MKTHLIAGKSMEIDESKLELEVADDDEAVQLSPSLGPGLRSKLDFVLDQDGSTDCFGCGLDEWV
jgi:hypothetical protein